MTVVLRAREEERVDLTYPCIARFPAGAAGLVMSDVSTGGCRLSTHSLMAQKGATVLLELGRLRQASGEIVWRKGGQCGVQFHRPIPIEWLDWLAARQTLAITPQ